MVAFLDTSDSNNELALAATSNSLLSEAFRCRTNMPVAGVIDRLSLLVLLQVRVSHRNPIRRWTAHPGEQLQRL